jgi:hypothetical protein
MQTRNAKRRREEAEERERHRAYYLPLELVEHLGRCVAEPAVLSMDRWKNEKEIYHKAFYMVQVQECSGATFRCQLLLRDPLYDIFPDPDCLADAMIWGTSGRYCLRRDATRLWISPSTVPNQRVYIFSPTASARLARALLRERQRAITDAASFWAEGNLPRKASADAAPTWFLPVEV